MAASSDSAAVSASVLGHQDAIRSVGAALVARHAEIAQAMVERIVAEVPVYRRADRELLDDVLALSTATAEILGNAFAAARQVGREDVPIVREHAARRVQQGVDLEAFLHAYRAALFRYWDACAEEASRLGISREASLALARFALDAIDTVTTHAAEGYLREDARLRTQTGQAARDLVDRLIAGQAVGDARRHPAAPGLDPTGSLVMIVGRVEASAVPVGDALQVARDVLGESMALGKTRPLVTIRQGEIVLVTSGATTRHAVSRLRMARRRALDEHHVDARYGISITPAGFPGVPRAYREATLTLSYTSPARPVVSLDELSSLDCVLLGADATTRALIASKSRSLVELPDDDRAVATTTIRAFATCDMNIARTAQELYVHPNTVRYRLARIAGATGHDPRTFTGLADLVCMLEIGEGQTRSPG
jgi:PucR C-terminal helix-turn-helix domain/GGDEF-like domain